MTIFLNLKPIQYNYHQIQSIVLFKFYISICIVGYILRGKSIFKVQYINNNYTCEILIYNDILIYYLWFFNIIFLYSIISI